jgi:hypothetical protein
MACARPMPKVYALMTRLPADARGHSVVAEVQPLEMPELETREPPRPSPVDPNRMVQFPAMRDTIKVRVTRAIKGVNDDEMVIVDSFRGACEEGAVAAFKSESGNIARSSQASRTMGRR